MKPGSMMTLPLLIALVILQLQGALTAKDMKIKYSNGENVRVRSLPDEKSKPLDNLARGEAVFFLDEISTSKSRIKIKNREHHEPWLKIKTAKADAGQEGWVFAPLLSDRPSQVKRLAIIAFTDTSDVSEDWNFFYNDIMEAFKNKGIHVTMAVGVAQVPVGPDRAPFDIVSIGAYIAKYHLGYICYKNGTVKYVMYNTSDESIREMKQFFGR